MKRDPRRSRRLLGALVLAAGFLAATRGSAVAQPVESPPPSAESALPATPSSATPAPDATLPATSAPEARSPPPSAVPAPPAAATGAAERPLPAETETDRLALELQAELVERAIGDVTGDDYRLDIYGFLDFTYTHLFSDFEFVAPFDSFAVGNFNVYLASELGDNWRTLAEVRYSYVPHGTVQMDGAGTSTRIDTSAQDYTDFNRPLRWGSTIIERAWLEYTAHPLLTLRVGHWLTPYGIWNVDHGSPVVIGVRRPYIVGEALLPQSQTGIELRGTHNFARVQLGYHFTLSNGRGPIDTHRDLDDDKALGGRLFARADTRRGTLTLGMSGYRGRYTDRGQEVAVEDGTFVTSYPRTAEYDEVAVAADLKWEYRGFLLQTEAIVNDRAYDDALRPRALTPEGPGAPLPDTRRFGVYGLAGYRCEWFGLMPFAGLEYYDAGQGAFIEKSAAFWGGLNVRPTARVVLKAQYTYSWFPDGDGLPEAANYNALDLQAAWSF